MSEIIDLTQEDNELQITVSYEQYMAMNDEQREGVQILDCSGNKLTVLPPLHARLQGLICRDNQLRVLPTLPAGLKNLECGGNFLTDLPNLPAGLKELDCDDNLFVELSPLPAGLELLNYADNKKLDVAPVLPESLTILNCGNAIPPANYPNGLLDLHCTGTFFDYDRLPDNLSDNIHLMDYSFCELEQEGHSVKLPKNLQVLGCAESYLPSPSELPSNIKTLRCTQEQMGKKKRSYMKRFPNLEIEYEEC